jgi:hypothetical protein
MLPAVRVRNWRRLGNEHLLMSFGSPDPRREVMRPGRFRELNAGRAIVRPSTSDGKLLRTEAEKRLYPAG